MSILRALAFNSSLSLLLLFCFFACSQSNRYSYYTTTTTTMKPWHVRTPGLSLPLPNSHPPKCQRQVPAVFFQYERDSPVVGNSTNSAFFNIIDVCCHGYKRYDFDWSRCVPDCGNKCQQNGFCLEGGVCKCFDEFVLNYRNVCVPTCPLDCPDGRCYLNGTCVCNRGYELDGTRKYCMPHCELGCARNELCAAPNKCECAEGYAREMPDKGTGCQPVCLPHCGFGRCVAPNRCECLNGYIKRENRTICEDKCYLLCENGFCPTRSKCVCHDGYRYDVNTTSCLPECGLDCENGICIAPGMCRCFNGYIRNGTKCNAICEKSCGYYGKCIAPNLCGCSIIDGPLNNYQHCAAGSCTSKGRCRCNEGYTRFIDKCLLPNEVTAYASMRTSKQNQTLINEFNLLIGRHFQFNFYIPIY